MAILISVLAVLFLQSAPASARDSGRPDLPYAVAANMTCAEARAFVEQHGTVLIEYRGLFGRRAVAQVVRAPFCDFTQMPVPAYFETSDARVCAAGFRAACAPDDRYQP